MQLPLFAFFLTKEGLYYYRGFGRQDNTFFDSVKDGIPQIFFILAKVVLEIPYIGLAVELLFIKIVIG